MGNKIICYFCETNIAKQTLTNKINFEIQHICKKCLLTVNPENSFL